MKAKLAKIFSLIPFLVYGVLAVAYLIAYLDFIFGDDLANSQIVNLLKIIGDCSGAVFGITLLFGWIVVLPCSVAGAVFAFFSGNTRWKKICFYSSLLNGILAVVWAYYAISFMSVF